MQVVFKCMQSIAEASASIFSFFAAPALVHPILVVFAGPVANGVLDKRGSMLRLSDA